MSENVVFINKHRQQTTFDLRVELLYDCMMNHGINDLDVVIKSNGLFYRNYSKDKMNISQDLIDPDVINIDISRDGFYDILPENITHNSRHNNVKDDPVLEFKNRKKEEKEARHFFSPLENEFFRFRHSIESYESDFFAKISANGVVDVIKEILAVGNTIPDMLVVKMYYALLKHNANPVQSIDNTVAILEKIIDEKVSYSTSNIELENVYDVEEKSGDFVLGINTTLESNQHIFLKRYHFSVGPLKNSNEIQKYFQNQVMETFLTTFFNLFLPFHLQFSFEVLLNKEDELFAMDETNYKSRLGISTVL
jgi:hypothetical protein